MKSQPNEVILPEQFQSFAQQAFGPLMNELGFTLAERKSFSLIYKSGQISCAIMFDVYSSELGVSISRDEDFFQLYELEGVERSKEALQKDGSFSTIPIERLKANMDQCVHLLKMHAIKLLKNDNFAWAHAKRGRLVYFEKQSQINLLDELQRTIEEPWQRKDYLKVYKILIPHRDRLNQSQLLKLNFAKKKIGKV